MVHKIFFILSWHQSKSKNFPNVKQAQVSGVWRKIMSRSLHPKADGSNMFSWPSNKCQWHRLDTNVQRCSRLFASYQYLRPAASESQTDLMILRKKLIRTSTPTKNVTIPVSNGCHGNLTVKRSAGSLLSVTNSIRRTLPRLQRASFPNKLQRLLLSSCAAVVNGWQNRTARRWHTRSPRCANTCWKTWFHKQLFC